MSSFCLPPSSGQPRPGMSQMFKIAFLGGVMKWESTPVFLPGESYGRRSLVGYSPPDRKESDTTKRLHFTSLNENPSPLKDVQ